MCDKNPYHQFIIAKLNLALENQELAPTEKKQLEEAKSKYEETCSRCKKDTSNHESCIKFALDELLRMLPSQDKWKVYPWRNYDWDYGEFINNNFSATATGSSPDGLFKNLLLFFRYIDAYITDPNPGTASIAGGTSMTDRESDFPVYGVDRNNYMQYKTVFELTRSSDTNNKPPYDDPFFKKFPLAGMGASSYFVRVGSCDRGDITDREECAKNNFEWKSGNCYQPRYAYMSNESPPKGSFSLQGTVPSIIHSTLAFSPGKVMNAFQGKSNSRMQVQECPPVGGEGFVDLYNPRPPKPYKQFGMIEIAIIIMGLAFGYMAYDMIAQSKPRR
jgi:hypothetical protein